MEQLELDRSQKTRQEPHLHRTGPDSATRHKKPMIKWPIAFDKKLSKLLDEDLEPILEASMQGQADRKLQTLITIDYSVAKERLGQVEVKACKEPPRPMKRQTRIDNL
ncbi:hypothetical protein DPMN_153615 [Dreissena polymorpha]|uniref:Uncharacterized protein n=1 Tax=Dreissena polymorpha TaxID=45954 RepID=A0A9D4FNG9_DREPO|nr:hypothetical protein DPMN_153615 [Dreissena polymorpha]